LRSNLRGSTALASLLNYFIICRNFGISEFILKKIINFYYFWQTKKTGGFFLISLSEICNLPLISKILKPASLIAFSTSLTAGI